jgi:hypothetical protein
MSPLQKPQPSLDEMLDGLVLELASFQPAYARQKEAVLQTEVVRILDSGQRTPAEWANLFRRLISLSGAAAEGAD